MKDKPLSETAVDDGKPSKALWWFIILLLLLVLFSLFRVSSYDLNVTFEQQSEICGLLNFTFLECYELWATVNNASSCVLNQTTCSNKTVFLDKNCSLEIEYKRVEWDHEEEMARITQNDSCDFVDCSSECEASVQAIKEQYESAGSSSDSSLSNNVLLVGVISLVIFLVIVYFVIKKTKSKFVTGMTTPSYGYTHSPPPFSSPVVPLLPEPPKPSDMEGSDAKGF